MFWGLWLGLVKGLALITEMYQKMLKTQKICYDIFSLQI